jgi:hypothetical protein
MGTTIYEGKEQGVFDWRFGLLVNRWDPTREIRTNETRGTEIEYEAFLPEYGVTARYEGKMMETAKVTLDGEPDAVAKFREMVEGENSQLLAVVETAE